MRRRLCPALLFLPAAALILAGCGGGAAGTRTLVYGTTSRPSGVDPAQAYDFPTLEVLQNIHRGLVGWEPGTARLAPVLAAGWSANQAADEFTVRLRGNLRFPDGTPLTAGVVKWAVERAARLQGDASWLVTDFVSRVDALDERTVRFTLKRPTAFFPALLACAPYFPVSPGTYPADRIAYGPQELGGIGLAGLGPYRAVASGSDAAIVLEADPGYRGPRPGIERIVIRVFPESAALRLALEKGEIDIAFRGLRPPDIERLSAQGGISVHRRSGPQIRTLCFETSQSVFGDRRLRQAIAALVDRRQIVDKVFLGRATPAYSMVPAHVEHHLPSFRSAYGEGPDPARAERLLREAGYTAEAPLRFELWHAPARYGQTDAAAAELLKSQLEKSKGVSVTVRSTDWPTYRDQWRKRRMPAWLLGWYPDYIDADAYTAPFAGTAGSGNVGVNFSSAEWDRWIALEQGSLERSARGRIFQMIQQAWTEEVPTIPLWHSDLYVLTRSGVEGVRIDPATSLDFAALRLE